MDSKSPNRFIGHKICEIYTTYDGIVCLFSFVTYEYQLFIGVLSNEGEGFREYSAFLIEMLPKETNDLDELSKRFFNETPVFIVRENFQSKHCVFTFVE